MCGMDEFSVTVSIVGRDKKDKEIVEVVDDLSVSAEDQQVGMALRILYVTRRMSITQKNDNNVEEWQ